MPGWLKWKKPKLISRAARKPVPFSIQCVCGRLAEGERSARYQQVICLDCGEPLFVLPLNTYPAPTVEEVEKEQQPAPPADSDDTSEATVTSGAVATKKSTAKSKSKTGKQEKRKKAKSAPRPDAVPISKMKRPSKRLITPFRLTLVAITGVLIGTVWYSVQSSRFENAEVTLRSATESGFTAIENKEYVTAAAEFEKAADAASIVAPQSRQARMLHQMRDQLTVATNLSGDSLIDILQRADESPDKTTEFDTDGWMVIDSYGRQTTNLSGSEIVEISFPIGLGEADVVIDCSLAPFQQLKPGSSPQRMIFAAQVSGLDYQSATPSRWSIHLNPETIVVWSDADLFDSLGFESDDDEQSLATSQLLTRQGKQLGIAE